jgi:hypothetical protein
MRRMMMYLLTIFALSAASLAVGVLAFRAEAGAAITRVYLWGLLPVLAAQAWMLIQVARQLGVEGRRTSAIANVLGGMLLVGYFVCIGLWVLVLLRPMLEASAV